VYPFSSRGRGNPRRGERLLGRQRAPADRAGQLAQAIDAIKAQDAWVIGLDMDENATPLSIKPT
jgi:hypothetical protein